MKQLPCANEKHSSPLVSIRVACIRSVDLYSDNMNAYHPLDASENPHVLTSHISRAFFYLRPLYKALFDYLRYMVHLEFGI